MPMPPASAGREAMRRMAMRDEAELEPADGELSEGKLDESGKPGGGVVLRIEVGPEDDEAWKRRMRGLRSGSAPPADLVAEPEV